MYLGNVLPGRRTCFNYSQTELWAQWQAVTKHPLCNVMETSAIALTFS